MKIWLLLAVLLLSGCGLGLDQPSRDLTSHFWKYVHGDYVGQGNSYLISLNPQTHTATWYKPLAVGNSQPGAVCYLSVQATIESVSNGPAKLFVGFDSPTLVAKATGVQWNLVYRGTPTSSDTSECESILASNSEVTFDPVYIPVLMYGPDVLQLGHPQYCFFACSDAESVSPQDFSKGAPAVYRRGSLPW